MRSGNVRVYAVLVATALGLAFGTPLRALWLRDGAPWWSVFVLWAVAVHALFALAHVAGAEERRVPPADRGPDP